VKLLDRLAHAWTEGLLRISQALERRFWKRRPR
jgi:hypothetical protein